MISLLIGLVRPIWPSGENHPVRTINHTVVTDTNPDNTIPEPVSITSCRITLSIHMFLNCSLIHVDAQPVKNKNKTLNLFPH